MTPRSKEDLPVGKLRAAVRRVAKVPGYPLTRYFNRRFADLHLHLDNESDRIATAVGGRVDESVTAAQALQDWVASDVETVAELTLTMQRFADRFGDRVDELLVAVRRLLDAAGDATRYDPSADPARMVAVPLAYAAAARLGPGGRVLLLENDDPALALSLASLGLVVTVVGGGTGAAAHPNVTAVGGDAADWEGPAEPFDLAVWLLPGTPDAEARRTGALDLVRKWLALGGELVLAGRPTGDLPTWERVDWETLERRDFAALVPPTWEPHPAEVPPGTPAVTVLRLSPRA